MRKDNTTRRDVVLFLIILSLVLALTLYQRIAHFCMLLTPDFVVVRKSDNDNTHKKQLVDSETPSKLSNERISIAFLFLSTKRLNEELWEAWFPPAPDARYSIFVHTASTPKGEILPLGPFFCPYAIPSLATQWGDLYPGIMHTLRTALANEQQQHKKFSYFLLVSDTSIPLVSFDELYAAVSQEPHKARICWSELEQAPSAFQGKHTSLGLEEDNLRKGELWWALPRRHVELVLHHQTTTLDLWNFAMDRPFSYGATDEILLQTFLHCNVPPSEFSTCSSNIGPRGMPTCCTHAVYWGDTYARTLGRASQAKASLLSLTGSPKCHGYPCNFSTKLHENGLRTLRQEGFWMLRKVHPDTVVVLAASTESTNTTTVTLPLTDAILQLTQGKKMSLASARANRPETKDHKPPFTCTAP